MIAEGFEDLELFCPWFRLREEGVEVTVASPGGKPVNGRHGYRVESDMPIREQEVRRYLPQINPYGLIVMHDASSHLKTVREAALKLEQEGLISVVMLPTPRGLVVAQKREGRR